MVRIHPSLLAADLTCLRESITMAEEAGASALQIDIMDGHFVPNLTFGPKTVEDIRKHTSLPLEVHLMVMDPLRWIKPFYKAGANSLIAHYEASPHLDKFIQQCQALDLLCGVALNPATSIAVVEKIVKNIDVLLLMGVNPGFHGQQMVSYLPEKVNNSKAWFKEMNPHLLVEVDGGVNETNAPSLIQEGADILILGASFYLNPKRNEFVKHLFQLSST
ncbi:MAG: Ribulose-phosphate 3-epimerase [candidate division WS2 bacterium]|nr:Ribulose-phosphate 3-epimerase [Candidatus Lithacetigena glycinireducens]